MIKMADSLENLNQIRSSTVFKCLIVDNSMMVSSRMNRKMDRVSRSTLMKLPIVVNGRMINFMVIIISKSNQIRTSKMDFISQSLSMAVGNGSKVMRHLTQRDLKKFCSTVKTTDKP